MLAANTSVRMKSSRLFVTSIATISASCNILQVVKSFSITRHQQQLSAKFRCVHLPTTTSLFDSASADEDSSDNIHQSVTGPIYEMDGDIPTVKLFTKHGCTLCDKVKDVRVFDI